MNSAVYYATVADTVCVRTSVLVVSLRVCFWLPRKRASELIAELKHAHSDSAQRNAAPTFSTGKPHAGNTEASCLLAS